MKARKTLLRIFIVVHLLVIFIINMFGMLDSTYSYYYGADYEKNVAVSVFKGITFFKPVWYFATMVGTNASYGFYAPNVSSSFGFVFTTYNSSGKEIATDLSPHLACRESLHRFSLCTSMMQEKLAMRNENKLLNDYFSVIVHEAAMEVKGYYPDAKEISAVVYLYDYPDMMQYRSGKRATLTQVDEYWF